MSPKVSDDHKEKRRLEILQAAKRVFHQKGFERATMSDIVAESGLSRGGVYWYFTDKEELIHALFEHLSEQFVLDLSQMTDRYASAWDALEAFVEENKQAVLRQADDPDTASVAEFFVSGWRDERRRNLTIARYRGASEQLHQLVLHGVKTGEFRPQVDLAVIVQGIFTNLDALQQSRFFLGPDVLDVEGQFALLKTFLRFCLGLDTKGASRP
ncbi:putative HTH-type transcriptional regulator YfiR [compost metagenome]